MWWFAQHHEMPHPPSACPRSGWFIFKAERVADLKVPATGGKAAKQIGREWHGMSEEEQEVYVLRHREIKERHEAEVDRHEAALVVWRAAKPPALEGSRACECRFCVAEEEDDDDET